MTPSPIDLVLPSPIRKLVQTGARNLWVKDDGAIGSVYGGNKARKLKYLLGYAQAQHKRHLVTVGVVGSHHVLATGLWGRHLGFDTTALLVSRPYSYHAEQTTKATQCSEMELLSLLYPGDYPRIIRQLFRQGSYFIPPGGTSALGALGYLDAALELEQQVLDGALPEPSHIFVALGTGGTAAGILAGLAASSLRSRLVAIPVLSLPAPRRLTLHLAQRALRLSGRVAKRPLESHLEIDPRWIGEGYGHASQAGESAVQIAETLGLCLESTYTGKAFAAAMDWLRGPVSRDNVPVRSAGATLDEPNTGDRAHASPKNGRGDSDKNALFWSTISSTIVSPSPPRAVTLRPPIEQLLRR